MVRLIRFGGPTASGRQRLRVMPSGAALGHNRIMPKPQRRIATIDDLRRKQGSPPPDGVSTDRWAEEQRRNLFESVTELMVREASRQRLVEAMPARAVGRGYCAHGRR